jgi:hypothetical protein
MKNKLFIFIMSLMIPLMMTTACLAEYVYVTKAGKKYHHAESRFIQGKETEKITLEEAVARGLEPSREYLKFKESQKAEEAPVEPAKKQEAKK